MHYKLSMQSTFKTVTRNLTNSPSLFCDTRVTPQQLTSIFFKNLRICRSSCGSLHSLLPVVAWRNSRGTTRPWGRLETGTLVTRSLVTVTVEGHPSCSLCPKEYSFGWVRYRYGNFNKAGWRWSSIHPGTLEAAFKLLEPFTILWWLRPALTSLPNKPSLGTRSAICEASSYNLLSWPA